MESQSRFRITPNLYTPIAIVVAGIIIGGAVLWVNSSHDSATGGAPTPVAVDVSKVKTQGEPFIGQANAPVTIAYWFDYQCPFCKQNEEQAMTQLIKDYVTTGKVRVVFKDFAFLGQDSDTLGHAARAVWEVAPDKFYAWHKAVFDNQGRENSGWATTAKIRAITAGVLTAAQTDQVMQLMQQRTSAYQSEMDADKAEGSSFGVTGTPSFIIGKESVEGAQPYAQIQAAVEDALKAAK
jgi:protein-disulfide isomerase